MTVAERRQIRLAEVPYTLAPSDEGWIAFNDELQIVASGKSEREAIGRFYDAALALVDYCANRSLPIPEVFLVG